MASFDECVAVLREAGRGVVAVTLVTNQEDGVASYATGVLRYHKPFIEGGMPVPQTERLETETALEYYFSDVVSFWPGPSGGFAGARQPFAASVRVDRLGLMIRPRNLTAVLTLESWNNHRFTVSLERKGDLLVGIGTPIGGGADSAVYLLSLSGPAPQG
jgi:hypothetical protein